MPSFIILALIQIAIPVKMILDNEKIHAQGKEYRLKAKLEYPDATLSGKYIRLSYEQDKFPVEHDSIWQNGETVFVVFKTDSSGYAVIDSLFKSKPEFTPNFVEAKIKFTQKEDICRVYLEYPFEKFFLEESRLSNEAMKNLRTRTESAQSVQSIIRIHSGKAAIKDILIDGGSILNL
ncbi:MAG: GDYXXLXY domain-containing protein [Saprospiraceae bacterium]|nr:GDYXXLXY domain-containing protein [Saprospiraceae bacterium]